MCYTKEQIEVLEQEKTEQEALGGEKNVSRISKTIR